MNCQLDILVREVAWGTRNAEEDVELVLTHVEDCPECLKVFEEIDKVQTQNTLGIITKIPQGICPSEIELTTAIMSKPGSNLRMLAFAHAERCPTCKGNWEVLEFLCEALNKVSRTAYPDPG